MNLKARRFKGVSETLATIFVALFLIFITALLLFFFLSRFTEIHVAVKENTLERRGMLMANAIMNNEKLCVGSGENYMRGVLDADKLNYYFINTSYLTSFDILKKVLITPVDLNITYPNSIILLRISDIEACNENECFGWYGRVYSPMSISSSKIYDFLTCLASNIKFDFGTFIRVTFGFLQSGVFGGTLSLWQPYDINKCMINSGIEQELSLTKNSKLVSKGLPIFISYPNGTIHMGRLSLVIGEIA